MGDKTLSATVTSQLKSAQAALEFMRTEHAKVLKGLHEEISQLKEHCSHLQFQLALQSSSILEDEKHRQEVQSLQSDLTQRIVECKRLDAELKHKNKIIDDLRQELGWQQVNLRNEIDSKNCKIDALRKELREKADTINQLVVRISDINASHSAGPSVRTSGGGDSGVQSRPSSVRSRLLPRRPQRGSTGWTTVQQAFSSRPSSTTTEAVPPPPTPEFRSSVTTLPPITTLDQSLSSTRGSFTKQLLLPPKPPVSESTSLVVDQPLSPQHQTYQIRTEQRGAE